MTPLANQYISLLQTRVLLIGEVPLQSLPSTLPCEFPTCTEAWISGLDEAEAWEEPHTLSFQLKHSYF